MIRLKTPFEALVFGGAMCLASVSLLRGADDTATVALPDVAGPYAVSRITETWSDENRFDSFPDAPAGTKTELFIWIWYPSEKTAGRKSAGYLPIEWQQALEGRPNPLGSIARDGARVRPASSLEGTLSPEQRRYPVIILRPGLGALTVNFTALAEDLASYGYVVIGFDAPYRSNVVVLPGGRVITRPANLNPEAAKKEEQARLMANLVTAWAKDVRFVVDRLGQMNASKSGRWVGRLDMEKLGIVGHSLGGATAALVIHDDLRFKAGVDLDGALYEPVIHDGLNQPFMFVLSDHGGSKNPADKQISAEIKSVYDRQPPDKRMVLAIRGANHFSFSDQMILRSPAMIAAMQAATGLKLEPRRGLEIAGETVRRFLDVHLKGDSVESVRSLLQIYPELSPELP